jgi:restriction system protein
VQLKLVSEPYIDIVQSHVGGKCTMNDAIFGGIHAGSRGQAEELFLQKNVVALGWAELGDLLKLPPKREAYKRRIRDLRTDIKPGAIPGQAGLYFRFAQEVKLGDIMLYPSKRDRMVHVGKVTGAYQYAPMTDAEFAHIRFVEWLGSFPRTQFTQGALWEIGSAISFLQVKNYAHEFLTALENKSSSTVTTDEDESIALVAEEIEQTTRDFILKQLTRHLKEHALEHFVAHLLECMGYRAKVPPPESRWRCRHHRPQR